jgi:hypothetical protein
MRPPLRSMALIVLGIILRLWPKGSGIMRIEADSEHIAMSLLMTARSFSATLPRSG